MMELRVKKLDNLLSKAFQEQGEKIVPPSSQKLWAELQLHPEFVKLQEIEEKLAGMQNEQKLERKGYDTFWRKHRYVTGLVAACFVLVVIFAQFAPFSGGVGGFVNELLALTRGIKGKMDISIQSEDRGESSEAPSPGEKGTELPLKNFPLHSTKETLPQRDASKGLSEQEQESEFKAAFSLEEDGSQKGFYDAQQSQAADEQEAQELLFKEETAFILALEEVNHLAPEGIWRVKYIPGGVHFREGTIIKTDRFLLSVHQEYENQEGHDFSLVQQFLQEEITSGRVITTADSLTEPIQVGPYNGYLRRQQPGFHTLTWLQERSIVTLSGELEEEQLYKILASMEDRGLEEER
jgi:hypothetical protein